MDCDKYIAAVKATKQYKYDCVFINCTVNRWIDSAYGWFGHYNRRNSKNGYYQVHVGNIFYDSSNLKLTAFVFIEYSSDYVDTAYEKLKDPNSHLFDSHTVMGFRDAVTKPWELFELSEIFIGLRGGSLQNAEIYHNNIFLNKKALSNRFISVYDSTTGFNTKKEPVEYTPCEKKFWSKSPLWKKGERVPGYYIFETFMNATPVKRNLRQFLKINYPDSILNLYK